MGSIPSPVKKAFNHVKSFHPEVTMVVFNKYGQWQFMDDNFDAPTFNEKIDMSLLEDACDSVIELPNIFHF
jgi:hypothetical protein